MAQVDTSIAAHATGAAAELVAQHSNEQPLKFYGGWFCPFVQRSWLVLHEKKIPYQYIEINPYKKEASFLELNPRGLIPTLAVPAHENSTHRKALYDSTIISEYLDEAFTEAQYGSRLLPEDPYDRARCRLWIDHINTRIIPAFYKFIQHTPEKSYSMEEVRREFLGHIKTLTKEMDSEGPWFLGERFSLVDIALAPWAMRLFLLDHYKPGGLGLPDANGTDEDDQAWQRWAQWFKAISERQSVKDTLSDKESYIDSYKRYAEDKTNSLVSQAARAGGRMP
ncbi:glutathione S-transferase [Plectosphaerella cucumerina]|uniref:Glutathione S-transferase n=1 Tax=Plectosphaerella cucumerina TaxID=40658 RepID=A0A8K0WXS1_9PEZI|nr:glutathione S-transferase [Plectosphaerella cucumerina]